MSVCLSFERRRARNYKVLCCIRRLCAYTLALNIRVAVRWIPSECNVSDEPSRKFDPSYKGPHELIVPSVSHLAPVPEEKASPRDAAEAMSDLGCAAAGSEGGWSTASDEADPLGEEHEQDALS